MRNVVLLSTRRLPPTYFDTVIEDLGGDPDLGLNVVAWMPPTGYVADKVETFTLIGPGRMPAKPAPEPVEEPEDTATATDKATDEAPDAVIAPEAVAEPETVTTEGEVTPAAADVPDTGGAPETDQAADAAAEKSPDAADEQADAAGAGAAAGGVQAGDAGAAGAGVGAAADGVPAQAVGTGTGAAGDAGAAGAGAAAGGAGVAGSGAGAPRAGAKPRPTGAKRVVKAVAWRYRKLRKVGAKAVPASVKNSRPVKFLRGNRQNNDLGKNYWTRIETRRDVLDTITKADVVIALDAGAIWAGWHLGQRYGQTPVVLGLPAARRELDRIKAGR